MANETAPPADERRTAAWVGTALRIEGRIISEDINLTIDGQVEGTIQVGDHNLNIGPGAAVKADLIAKTVTISGAVTGNVTASEKVNLQPTGSVDGDITTPRLVMADGEVIKGRVEARGARTATVT
jgi:cytoskeletal protein CcmA (bactofilin family)